MEQDKSPSMLERLEQLCKHHISLITISETDNLLEQILKGLKTLTHANAGTLYFLKDDKLSFEFLINDDLNINTAKSNPLKDQINPVPLHDENGKPNEKNIVSFSVLNNVTVNVADAYKSTKFDFSGTRKIDGETGYKSQSLLTIPLRNYENEIIGALQVINKKSELTGEIEPFNRLDQSVAESYAIQAAQLLTDKDVVSQQLNLLEEITNRTSSVIKDQETHLFYKNLSSLVGDIIQQANVKGGIQGQTFTDDEQYEIEIATNLLEFDLPSSQSQLEADIEQIIGDIGHNFVKLMNILQQLHYVKKDHAGTTHFHGTPENVSHLPEVEQKKIMAATKLIQICMVFSMHFKSGMNHSTMILEKLEQYVDQDLLDKEIFTFFKGAVESN